MFPKLALLKIDQGHPRVIICANYDGLESKMLHTKFRGNRTGGSGEEDNFEWFLPYMGVAAILVMWSISREQTFVPSTHGCSTENFSLIGQAVSEKIFEIVDGRWRTDAGAWLSYKLTLRWANKGSLICVTKVDGLYCAVFAYHVRAFSAAHMDCTNCNLQTKYKLPSNLISKKLSGIVFISKFHQKIFEIQSIFPLLSF